jgi:4-hydroxy-4-methyl-2-oxoglutarate aldolase
VSTTDHIAALAGLYVAVVADTLDRLGHRDQVMTHTVRPQLAAVPPLIGAAHTIHAVRDTAIVDNPYEHEIAAVDAVRPGEIVVVATGEVSDVSIWGELLAIRADARGFAGAVTDGGIRDVAGLQRLGHPTFAASISARDSFGRLKVSGYGVPVQCGGVLVAPGDIVMGDLDGIVVIPAGLVTDVSAKARDKVEKEGRSRAALRHGASAADVYAEHGVL